MTLGRQRMPGFELHREVRAGHAELSVSEGQHLNPTAQIPAQNGGVGVGLGVWAALKFRFCRLRAHSTRRDRLEHHDEARTPASAGVRPSFRSSSWSRLVVHRLSNGSFEKKRNKLCDAVVHHITKLLPITGRSLKQRVFLNKGFFKQGVFVAFPRPQIVMHP